MMEHLADTRMIDELWDGEALSSQERDHLHRCEACQSRFATLAQLRDDFEVAKRSQLLPDAEERYLAIFAEATQNPPHEDADRGLLDSLAEWVRALPLWDSRDQALAIGVRNGNRSSYRVLYGTGTTEIELMIEAHNGLLRVVGELMAEAAEDQSDDQSGLALVELMAAEDAKVALETETDGNGRFELDHVPPGKYALIITPRYSRGMVINPLELT